MPRSVPRGYAPRGPRISIHALAPGSRLRRPPVKGNPVVRQSGYSTAGGQVRDEVVGDG